MRWKADPFAAEVIHVHSGGKVDVVYDIDGSVGIFLTANEHGLKVMGAEDGGKPCSVDGCTAKAQGRGLCGKRLREVAPPPR